MSVRQGGSQARGIPRLRPGASRGLTAPLASRAELDFLGLPTGLDPDWPGRFLTALDRAVKRNRALELYLSSCTGCGACIRACPYFLGGGDPRNIPMARIELMRRVYKKYLADKSRRENSAGTGSLDLSILYDWQVYFHQCSLCRACAQACPLGIDTAQATLAAREVLASVGMVARPVARSAMSIYRWGNSWGLTPAGLRSRAGEAEQRLVALYGETMSCPVDEPNCDVLMIPAAGDLMGSAQGLMAYAQIFHAAGVSWTVSSFINDAYNPGLFLGYKHMRLISHRVRDAARVLKPKMIIWGESGSGWAVARNFSATLAGGWEQEKYLEVPGPVNILEWIAAMLRKGLFKDRLRKEANDQKNITLHDPCFLARWGGMLKEPRSLLSACCNFFYELPPQVSGARTQCCGGGGGLTGSEFKEVRMTGFIPRAETLKHAIEEHGIAWVASPCSQCRSTIREGSRKFDLELQVTGLSELFAQTLYPSRGA